jgi:mono/diheme cytochrome c family protein
MSQGRVFASIVALSLLLGATARAEVDTKTQRLWKAKCASCHGQTGKADTELGKSKKIHDMSTPSFQAKKDEELKDRILNGVKKEEEGVKKVMQAFKNDLTPEQVDSLVALIRTFKP